MSWQNAPPLSTLTASQQGGKRGAQLWGLNFKGTLNTIFQETPGGSWSPWVGPKWNGHPSYPPQVYDLAAAQQNDGRVQLFALDVKMQLWATWQTSPGGDWSAWSGPNWNNAPRGMKRIAASQQGGTRGAQLWGITEDYSLVTCFQLTAGGNWSDWRAWAATPEKSQFIEITAAQQNNGCVQLWAIDIKQQLWSCAQFAPGSDWNKWSGPRWDNTPPLLNIAACQQGGSRGAQLWGIKPDYSLVTNYQLTPGGQWSGWTQDSLSGAPHCYELTAAQQNNGCCQLWVVGMDDSLYSITQTSPGGNWTAWQASQHPKSTPAPHGGHPPRKPPASGGVRK